MILRTQMEAIRYAAFVEGVLEGLTVPGTLRDETRLAAVIEAKRRISRVLEILNEEPVTYFPTAPIPAADLDPCAGCAPDCGSVACPKRLVVSYADPRK